MTAAAFETAVAAFLVLFARVGAVLMLLPVFSEDSVPGRIRLLIASGMTAGLWGLLSPAVRPALGDMAALPLVLIAELMTGLAMGALVKLMFAAISVASSIVSTQVGLSSAIIFDPAQAGQAALLARFVGIVAAILCMSMHVHHLWLASIISSYHVFPVGGLVPAGDFSQLAVHVVGQSMQLGIGLAAPLILYGIVFNVSLGLAARLAPAIQIYFIAQPLNLLLGVALVAATLGGALSFFADAMAAFMRSGLA